MIGRSGSCTQFTVTKQKDPDAKDTTLECSMHMPVRIYLLQIRQCFDLAGLLIWQVSQSFCVLVTSS